MAVRRAVVVEDDTDLRTLLRELFHALGVSDCIPCASMAEVEAAAERVLGSDLVVLDVNLGAGKPSGIDVHRWLLDRGFKGRVVFLTGHAQSHPLLLDVALKTGARVFEKPIGIEELVGLVEAA